MHKKWVPDNILLQQWKQGPLSDQALEPGHGRGIFCMSIQNNSLVTGSADHGLREYDLNSMKYRRELFAKRYGHHEWVTSVCHLKDGRILSAGMDQQLCLWDAKIVRCDHITGHQGSITKVLVDDFNIAISSSYDHTLIIWDLATKTEVAKLFGPHKDSVLDFVWQNSLVVSGDKNGTVALWDINTGQAVKSHKIHKGAVSQIMFYNDGNQNNLIVTAGINDGMISILDMRSNELVHQAQIHSGSINALCSNLSSFIVTGSADKTIKMIDVLSGFKVFKTMKATDGVYCLQPIYNLTVAGTGDGNVYTYDNDTGKCLYGFGAMQKGMVRNIQSTDDCSKLVAIGDDFSPVVLNFDK